jgi:predicted dehydrogenase
VEDAKVLVAAAARAGKRNCLCHNLRYYPVVQQMRRLCETGEQGEILVVQGRKVKIPETVEDKGYYGPSI